MPFAQNFQNFVYYKTVIKKIEDKLIELYKE